MWSDAGYYGKQVEVHSCNVFSHSSNGGFFVSVKSYLLAQKLARGYQNKPKKKSLFIRKIMPVMGNNNNVTIRVYLIQSPLILRVYGLGLLQTKWTAQQRHKVFIHVPNGQITTKQRKMSLSDDSRCFALKHKSRRLKKQQKEVLVQKSTAAK